VHAGQIVTPVTRHARCRAAECTQLRISANVTGDFGNALHWAFATLRLSWSPHKRCVTGTAALVDVAKADADEQASNARSVAMNHTAPWALDARPHQGSA